MKKNIIKYIIYLVTALPLGGVGGGVLISCDDIVDYNDNYTPADQLANTGAPVIRAVYDVADTAFATPITQGTLGQTVVLVGENLNQAQAVSFNTVLCDMKNVYTQGTRAIVQIPGKLSMEQVNKIEYTTPQGTTTYDFTIPFPELTVSGLVCEFTNAGDSVTISGQNFDLYFTDGSNATVSIVSPSGDEKGVSLGVGSITATSMKVRIPEGTPDNTDLIVSWQKGGAEHTATLPFRPSAHLLFGDFSGITPSIDGTVAVAIEDDNGIGASAWLNQKNLHFTGTYSAWAWNTIDLSCNMIDQTVPDASPSGLTLDDYVLKMEVLTQSSFPLTEQTGLQFCFNWGDSYAWNPADGQGINTRGQWQTVTLPLAPMATNGISAPNTWQTLRITFQPHADYEADFRLANLRIVRK